MLKLSPIFLCRKIKDGGYIVIKRSWTSFRPPKPSRESDEEREKNLWLPWPQISLSCRRQLSNASNCLKRATNGNLANTCLSAAIFLSGGRLGWLGKLCYEQTISTWVVKSDLLIGVKLKHVLTIGEKSPGIRTPLYKDTNIVPNDCCRICRINVKISGRSKINVFSPFPFFVEQRR